MNQVQDNDLVAPDLSEAVDFGSVPRGIYKARITDSEIKTSKAGGTYIKWTLSIFGAEGDLTKFNNSKVWHNTMTSGKAAGMLKSLYKAATNTELTGQFNRSELIGKEVELTLKEGIDNRNGQPTGYPEVKAVKPLQPF